MHSKSKYLKFTSYNHANEVVNQLFDSLRSRYQGSFETSCHKVNFRRGGSYIDSSDWIKKKKTTINPKIKMINAFNMR